MTRTNQTLQTCYWRKAREKGLSADEILIEIFLINCPECGASGLFRMAPTTIGYMLGYPIPKVETILKSLVKRGRIYRVPGDWILVTGKFEYEHSKSPTIRKSVLYDLEVAPTAIRGIFLTVYKKYFPEEETQNQIPIPIPIPLTNTVPIGVNDTLKDTPTDTLTDKDKHNNGTPKNKYLDLIYLTDEEHAKLKERYGDKLDRILEIYDAWKTNSPRRDKIKSDYKSLLQPWLLENYNKTIPKDSFKSHLRSM